MIVIKLLLNSQKWPHQLKRWPVMNLSSLVMSCFIFFVEHEGPLTAVNISNDGLFVLAGTKTVSIAYV